MKTENCNSRELLCIQCIHRIIEHPRLEGTSKDHINSLEIKMNLLPDFLLSFCILILEYQKHYYRRQDV